MEIDHFGLIAGLYNRTAQYTPTISLLEILDLRPDGLLLDAGGGTGRVAQALKTMVRKVVVLDSSRAMLRYAVVKGLETICSPAEHLPFGSDSFNHIIMVDAFHHLANQRDAISELWRVLAPGGIMVIIEPNIHKLAVKLIAIGERLLLMHSHFFPPEKIAILLERPNTQVKVIYDEISVWVCAERVREM
jgi:demethylmenaquinone methyltransferase/2-methoxy-6-polyprenyl-1,4-benzoquinol methylase